MKLLKIVLLSILSLFTAIYLAFLFVLPNFIDLDKYSPEITKMIQDNTGLKVVISGLKISTAWNLSAGVVIDKTDIKYPNDEKFAQINKLQVRVPLLPLLFKRFKIDAIDADKIFFNLDVDKNGNFLLNQYIMKNHPQSDLYTFNFSSTLPDIYAKKYRISLIDRKTLKKYSVKGSDLKISDFILDKKIKLRASGELFLKERKHISYNIDIYSTVFKKNSSKPSDLIKVFEDMLKYNIKAQINADLVIKDKGNNPDVDGKINLDKISFVFGDKIFPQSNLKLNFKGDKARINASFNVDKNSKALVTGFFNTGKHKLIDLHITSDRINAEDVLLIVKAMSKPLGFKNLQNISAKGLLKADFDIKSNFKKIESNGYLKIKDGSISDSFYKVMLSSINADIDFSQDSVRLKQAMANLNGQPIKICGVIDKNAIANISILANNLQLKSVLLTAGQTKILNQNLISNGTVDIKGQLKGRLDKASWNMSALIDKVHFKNKASNSQINIAKTLVTLNKNNKNIQISDLKIHPQNNLIISIPRLNLNVNNNELSIQDNYLYIGNIKTIISGKILNIDKNPTFKSITVNIPNQISVPIKGYAGSKIVLKGNVEIEGNFDKPKIQGAFIVPLISIPSLLTSVKYATIDFDKDIKIVCPSVKVANSVMQINAIAKKDFSQGFVIEDIDLIADSFDLNYLVPMLKNLSHNTNSVYSNFAILNGKTKVKNFKVGNIVAANVTSDISLKNNMLYLNNLFGDAYLGKIAGDINYNLIRHKTSLNIQGRNLNSNLALLALSGQDDDIHGRLDFDSNISMFGYSRSEILKNLNGYSNFIISNGKMGILGKFEHLLYAQNIIANNIFRANLNLAAKAVTVKNTGVYKYMKGKITLSNGWANINYIKTSGPSMSLYMVGRVYLPDNMANLTILGRISDDIVRVLGPIGEFSMDKIISYIPKIGEITTLLANQFTTNPNYENISEIPYLSPKTEFRTKEFKVIIDGDIRKQSSVKSFKWLSHPKIIQAYKSSTTEQTSVQEVPDFVKNLPDYTNQN